MARYKVVPTKTNLLKLKRERLFAQEGYDLLEQKRKILVLELMQLMDKTVESQEILEKNLAAAFEALEKSAIAMGRQTLEGTALSVNIEADLSLSMRRLMGVNIPQVQVAIREQMPSFSPEETSIWVDESISRFKGILEDLGKLAEFRVSLIRISEEVRKTMQRVNALEKIAIPDYNESIKYIEGVLEENEREMFATLKLVKEGLEKRKG